MKDYGVYLLLRLDKQKSVKTFVKDFVKRSKTDINLARIWKRTFCKIVDIEKEHYKLLIRLEPFVRFTRHAIPLFINKAAKLGLEKAGYTGKYESCNDVAMIKEYTQRYILNNEKCVKK